LHYLAQLGKVVEIREIFEAPTRIPATIEPSRSLSMVLLVSFTLDTQ
jgi:hypothetical protein